MIRVPITLLFTGVLALTVAACGVPIQSAGDFAQGASIDPYTTFGWNQEADLAIGDPRLENNRVFEDRLHEAIEWELSLRGLRESETSPDLLVHHHLTLADHEMVEEVIDEYGYTQTEVYAYEEGTVVVHIIDARTRANVWLGWAQANVEPALRSPENMQTWVYDIVGEMFESWPVLTRVGEG